MVIETIFWRQPLRKGMQRCVLYTCMSTNQKHERQGVAIQSAETYLITVLTFSRNSSASGWKLFASVFHSLQVRSARWDPLVSKYLWSRGADIAATCSGVKPSSAPLQCPNMKRDNRTEIKTKRNEGEKKKNCQTAYICSFAFRTAMTQSKVDTSTIRCPIPFKAHDIAHNSCSDKVPSIIQQ